MLIDRQHLRTALHQDDDSSVAVFVIRGCFFGYNQSEVSPATGGAQGSREPTMPLDSGR